MILGWRPHDIDASYLPFGQGVGTQVGVSDPVFMAQHNMQPIVNENPKFPYEPNEIDALYMKGDAKTIRDVHIGRKWLAEANSGEFRSWEDLQFLRDNWDGLLILKGIQSVKVDVLLTLARVRCLC